MGGEGKVTVTNCWLVDSENFGRECWKIFIDKQATVLMERLLAL